MPWSPAPWQVKIVHVGGVGAPLVGRLHSLGDIRGLAVDAGDDAAGLGVEAVLGPRVADPSYGLTCDRRDLHVRIGGYLSGDHHEAVGDQGLARHPAVGIFREDGIQYRVGDLVGHLVGMAFAHRLGREQEFSVLHIDLQE